MANAATCLFLLFILISCKDVEPAGFVGCCSIPAIDTAAGNAHVYIPNVFTPDGDAINDYFTVYSDINIVNVISMEIADKTGKIAFYRSNFAPNDPAQGWDGRIKGRLTSGLFRYWVRVEDFTGYVTDFKSFVCNYPCNYIDFPILLSGEGCQFPSQVTDGQYDETLPSNETNGCFD